MMRRWGVAQWATPQHDDRHRDVGSVRMIFARSVDSVAIGWANFGARACRTYRYRSHIVRPRPNASDILKYRESLVPGSASSTSRRCERLAARRERLARFSARAAHAQAARARIARGRPGGGARGPQGIAPCACPGVLGGQEAPLSPEAQSVSWGPSFHAPSSPRGHGPPSSPGAYLL